MKRIEGEGGEGQSSQSVPYSSEHWKELKDRGLTTSTPSPSMRQTDYKQVNAGDKFTSLIAGELTVASVTGEITHVADKKGQTFMVSTARLKELKAKRRSVSFNIGVNHGMVMISSEDDRDSDLWRSMCEIFKRNGYTPDSGYTMFQKLDTNIEDETAKLIAEFEKEGYKVHQDSSGGLNSTFYIYFDSEDAERAASKRKIVAVMKEKTKTLVFDFDGTITSENTFPEIADPNEEIVAYMEEAKQLGFEIIIHSCRTSSELNDQSTAAEQLKAMTDYLALHDIPYDEICTSDKPLAVAYIDDKGCNVLDAQRLRSIIHTSKRIR